MEVLEKEVAQDKGIMVLRAYRPKTQSSVKVSPCYDSTGRIFTGQGQYGYWELLTDAEKKDLAYVVTPNTVVVLTDGKTFNLDGNPMDRANWKWIKKHPYISLDKAKGSSSSRTAVLYLEDRIGEAKQRVAKSADIDDARYAVRKLSVEKRKRAAKILGLVTADAFEEDQLLDWLLETSNFTPKAVLQAVNPENAEQGNAQIFFNELIKYKVLVRETTGMYKVNVDGGLTISHTPENVIDWLLDGANNEMVRNLQVQLKERKTGK